MKQHLLQFLIAIDQVFNTIFGGWADETLSSRAWRLYLNRGRAWPMRIINALFFWQENHCKESYESELNRTQCPPQLRDFEV